MADTNGTDIQLSVGLTPGDIRQTSKKLQGEFEQIFKKAATMDVDKKFESVQTQMAKAHDNATRLMTKMDELATKKVPTQEYQEIEKQLNKDIIALAKLKDRKEKFLATGGKAKSSAFKKMNYDIEELEASIKFAKSDLQDLVDTGKAFTLGSDTSQYRDMANQLNNVSNQMVMLKGKAADMGVSIKNTNLGLVDSFKQIPKMFKDVVKNIPQMLKKVDSAILKTAKGFAKLAGAYASNVLHLNKFGKSLKSIIPGLNDSSMSFKKLFWNVLKYGLGIRSLYVLFRKIRSAITENLKYFASMNDGMNDTNKAMSSMQSSLNYLKASLTAAFIPILTVVSPIISSFIDKLAEAINMIGMFIARLLGVANYTKAIKKNTDYAKSLDKVGKSAKDANKQLATFDELNVLNKQKDTSGGGKYDSAPFDTETIKLDKLDWDWDMIKKKAEELGRKLARFLNDIFKNEDLAKEIGHNIAEALNTALHFAYGFIDELDWRQMGRWFGVLIQEGLETFEWDLLGKTIGELLNGIADAIIGFFETYQVGTLGHSIATMLNNAIATVDPIKIGQAILDLLQAPLIELSTLLKETNWKQATQKLNEFFQHVFEGVGLDGQTLGQTLGEALANLVNAAIDILINVDITGAVRAIVTFIEDLLSTVIGNVHWGSIIEGAIDIVFELILSSIYAKADLLISGLEFLHIISKEKGEEMKDSLYSTFDSVKTGVKSTMSEVGDAINDFTTATDKSIETIENKIDETDSKINQHGGSWGKFGDTLSNVDTQIDTTTKKQDELKTATENVGKVAEDTSGKVTNYVKISNDTLEKGTTNAQNYEANVVSAFQGVSDKSNEVSTDVNGMTAQLQTEVDSLTKIVATWYKEITTKYFDYNVWSKLVDDSMIKAMKDGVKEMTQDWSTSMSTWWSSDVVPMFAQTKWKDEFNHVYVAGNTVFTELVNLIQKKMEEASKSVKEGISNMSKSFEDLSKSVSGIGDSLSGLKDIELPDLSKLSIPQSATGKSVPGLASGAVIPPNHEFLARLGDQTSGTNIEAPLETIKQAMAETLGQLSTNIGGGDIVVQIDGYEVFRAIRNQSDVFRNSTGYGVL